VSSSKNIEGEVKKQSALLEKEKPSIASSLLEGKFIAFYNGETIVGNTHQECFDKALEKFGHKAFVIDELSDKKLLVSALIRI
jgi:hypothetical protein